MTVSVISRKNDNLLKKEKMTREEWLYRLRRCQSADTLEKVAEHQNYTLTGDALYLFNAAADHRRAEIVAGRYFDKIPKSLWRHVR